MISNALRYPPGPNRMTIFNFFELVSPLFPCLRKHLDVAVCVLNEGMDACFSIISEQKFASLEHIY